jgi:hypothetical protein
VTTRKAEHINMHTYTHTHTHTHTHIHTHLFTSVKELPRQLGLHGLESQREGQRTGDPCHLLALFSWRFQICKQRGMRGYETQHKVVVKMSSFWVSGSLRNLWKQTLELRASKSARTQQVKVPKRKKHFEVTWYWSHIYIPTFTATWDCETQKPSKRQRLKCRYQSL